MINPHIIRKTTSPVSAPPEAGIHWINTVTNEEFFSVGTSSVADWIPRSASAESFTDLSDTPSTYVGQGSKAVRVNSGETGLEFYTPLTTDERVKVSANDTTAKFLEDAITVSHGTNTSTVLEKTTINEGGDEDVRIQFDISKVDLSLANNTTSDFASESYVDGKVVDAINNGVTNSAPSQNAVFDALSLKADTTSIITDHGALTGLDDDDHPQYHNDTRGDIRYYTKSQSDVNYEPKNTNIQSHISSTSNPHNVTKTQVGLSNVDNTSDLNKPISTATQTALNAKQNSLGFTPANKAGDTFTGNVSIVKSSGNADFTIEAPLATDNKDISFKTNGLHRFIARVDGSTDDFTLRRHDDLGAHIDNPISVDRATGNVSIPVATSTTQSPNDNSTKIATTEYSDNSSKSAGKCIVRVYSSTDTWIKPSSGLKAVYVECGGGGGGGGSGRRGAAGSVVGGGGGGAGGAITRGWFQEQDLPPSLTVTVGAGSNGGVAVTTDNTNGNSAGAGGATSFGSLLSAIGGGGGGGGTASGASAGSVTFSAATPDNFGQKTGGGASATGGAGTAGSQSFDISAPGGGGGGGITAANALSNGAAGGARNGTTYRSGFTATGGTPGLNGSGVGGQGGNGSTATATYFGLIVGSGGGGGGVRSGASSGNGGNGTGFGSGGGGGAAVANNALGYNSGAGGQGGNGFCIVIEYY